VLFGLTGLVVLVLVSPYLVIDHETVLRNLRGEAQIHHLGATGGTPWDNIQWYLHGPLFSGFGIAGLLLIVCGAVLLTRQREALVVIGPVALGFIIVLCVQHLVWERWALPLMPLLAIAAALGLEGLGALLSRHLPPRLATGMIAIVLAATFIPLALRAEGDARARLNDTRQQAAHWAHAHIPKGSTVLIEHFAFDIVPEPWQLLFPIGDAGCIDAKALLQGKVQYSTIEATRGSRSNIDYGTLAPGKRGSCRMDYAILTQYDRYRVENAAFPAEYAAYRELLNRGEIIATFAPEDGHAGGPIVRIVHFAR
jgi:hypothetical protein